MFCYICDQPSSHTCKTCGSIACHKHFRLIHENKCKIGKREKITRLDIV